MIRLNLKNLWMLLDPMLLKIQKFDSLDKHKNKKFI